MIEIINLQHRYQINQTKFKNLLRFLVDHYKLQDPEVNLAFVDTKTIKMLNKKFRKKGAPTDVLSFPFGEQKSVDGKSYLGDIAIAVPQAFKQCFSQAHGLEKELADLAVHGFLHLLGFDHGKGIEEEEANIRLLLAEDR
jgi:probable rRNA maturation factor